MEILSGDGQFAVADGSTSWTWAEARARVYRMADRMARPHPDDAVRRVAILAHNSAEAALAHVAGVLAGVSIVPISAHLGADEVAFILSDSGADLLFADGHTADVAREAAQVSPVAEVVAWGDENPSGVTTWTSWLEGGMPAPPSLDRKPRPQLVYTSGTTGVPKGVELPPTSFAPGATIAAHLSRLAQGPMVAHGPHLVAGPMYHVGPLSGVRLLAVGVPLVILPRFDPEAALAAIERYRIGSAMMVPTHFVRLLALPEEVRARYDVSSLEYVLLSGASCPVNVKQAMLDWWGPIVYETYGATEAGPTCGISTHGWLKHPGSVGRALPPFEALVVDDDGKPVPALTAGRLYFRDTTGRGVRYHNDASKSAAAHLAPGTFTLGEIGYLDEDGYVFITDRFADMVVSGGVNVYPAEAERILLAHHAVADVTCIGLPDDDLGERLVALVVAADGVDPPAAEELATLCRSKLSAVKCPKAFYLVLPLPRNALGKLNKRQLRDDFARSLSAGAIDTRQHPTTSTPRVTPVPDAERDDGFAASMAAAGPGADRYAIFTTLARHPALVAPMAVLFRRTTPERAASPLATVSLSSCEHCGSRVPPTSGTRTSASRLAPDSTQPTSTG